MDENFVASEIHQLVPMSCFDLNELPQEGILFYSISLFIVYISFTVEYDVDFFFFFFNSCYNIEQMNDIVIASKIHQSVSRNCVDLNELPNDGENNDICGEELVVWNEYPMEEIGVIEENEDTNSIENEFEPFVSQCFLNEEEAFIFYKNYANRYDFTIQKCRFVTKNEENVRRDFFCHREGRQQLKKVDSSKEQQNRISAR